MCCRPTSSTRGVFARRLSRNAQLAAQYGDRKYVGPYACRDDTVALDGLDARVTICSRAYRDFDTLHDLVVRIVSLNEPKRGFSSQLNLLGIHFNGAMGFLSRYLESIRWAP